MSIIDELKFNWTEEDYFNFEDLNRIGESINFINDNLPFFYAEKLTLFPFTTKTMQSLLFANDLNEIETNINDLREFLHRPPNTIEPKMFWRPNDNVNFADLNRIEQNLYYLWQYYEGNAQSIPYCGMYTVGEEGVVLHGL